jgi:N-methylhydantoinase B
LNDVTVVSPIHHHGALVGMVGSTCHTVDIGGRGLSADAREVYEEGLQIPPVLLYREGRLNDDVVRIIEANVRAPREAMGDLHAQVLANDVGGKRVVEMLDAFGLADLQWLSDEIVERSRRRLGAAIEAIPDGRYESEIATDGFGHDEILIRCAISVTGRSIDIDFSGSSDQVDGGINVVLNYTRAYTTYAIQCALTPDIPHNAGTLEPISVRAPEGSILNAAFPAAVAARHTIGHFIPFAVFRALAPVARNAAVADGAGSIWVTTLRGQDLNGRAFVNTLFAAGGTGARPTRDGLSTTSFPSGISTSPIESAEATTPIVFLSKQIREGSGGSGRQAGGAGQRIALTVRTGTPWTVSCLGGRLAHPARGLDGGHDGAPAAFRIYAPDGSSTTPEPKVTNVVEAGGHIELELPGGGGYGTPDVIRGGHESVKLESP